MKVLHFADSHFSSKRLDECSKNFEWMIEYAENNDCTIAICAGDLFDKNTMINSEEYLAAIKYINRLSNSMPVYIIRGNHDPLRSLDVFNEMNNIYVFDSVEDVEIYDKNGESVNALFLPYINPAIFSSNKTLSGFYDSASNYYKEKIKEFVKKDQKKIIVSHISILGAELGNSEKIVQGEVMLDVNNFKGVDAVMLGHIHNHNQRLLEGTNIQYSGSHYRMKFGEKGVPGFIIWNINENITWDFIKTPAKDMVEIKLSEDDVDKFMSGEKLPIDIASGSDVKIVVDLKESKRSLFDKNKIVEMLPGCNVVTSIKTITTENDRAVEIIGESSLSKKFVFWSDLNNIKYNDLHINIINEMEQELGSTI